MATVVEWFDLAVRYHNSGNLSQAEPLYRQILGVDPSHADAHHLLGVLAYQTGRHDEALALIRQAIALNPDAAEFHANLSLVLKEQGCLTEAIASGRRALQLNPRFANALVNLGIALAAQGESAAAETCLRRALSLNPQDANAYCNLGHVLKDREQWQEASACYQSALRLYPQFVDALINLGIVLKEQKQLADAVACFRQALRLDPGSATAHANLGHALKQQGDFAGSCACFREALRIDPRYASALSNLGVVLIQLGQDEEALGCFHQALRILEEPSGEAAGGGLSARDRQRDTAQAQWNLALLRLLRGEMQEAWPGYELRWLVLGIPQRAFTQPRWDGSRLDGKTILLYAEQGLGDTIQFIRYAAVVKERGGTVVCECQGGLLRLLEGVAGVDRLVAAGAPLPHFDVQAPLLSLPGILGTTLATVPGQVPYLHAKTALIESWRAELAMVDGFKIGIAWQGNVSHHGDRLRSVLLTQFQALESMPGVRLISLQKGPGAEQLAAWVGPTPILNFGDRLDRAGAFIDTAAILMSLDLVVTVDTALVHLAGALGVPTWLVLSVVPDWRWLLKGQDSPWYPSVRLFRQNSAGDWNALFEQAATALRERVHAGA